jgi:hypothetical protein
VFGVAHRERINPEAMNRLLKVVPFWYPRTMQELASYRHGTRTPLGFWHTVFTPIRRWKEPRDYALSSADAEGFPADCVVSNIVAGRRFRTNDYGQLAVALGTADEVRYEQVLDAHGNPAGEMEDLMRDVFGRTMGPGQWHKVKRPQVVAYRKRVAARVQHLRAEIWECSAT